MNKFRNASNMRLTKALFYETDTGDKSSVLYTLKDVDHKGYPSLYRLYMETDDLLEFTFANIYLDGHDHWEILIRSDWFKPYVDRWRKELELRKKSQALRNVEAIAASGSKESFQANKFLLSWNSRPAGKGRPSKDDIRRAAHEEASTSSRINEDFDRLLQPQTEKETLQ